MKIELHNSMGKFDNEYCFRCLFNEKIFIYLSGNDLCLYYRTDDYYHFLTFYSKIKKFEESYGFGKDYKNIDPKWWKDPRYEWQDMR